MSTLFVTLAITFVIVILCLLLLGAGYLITGKSRLRVGMCGKIPTQKKGKDGKCGKEYTCGICGKEAEEEEEKTNADDTVH